MTTRAAHYRNQARHSQRMFGTEKPKPQPVGSDTIWIPAWLATLTDEPFGVDDEVALPLGDTSAEREVKLRKATALGVLHMSATLVEGAFAGYCWQRESR